MRNRFVILTSAREQNHPLCMSTCCPRMQLTFFMPPTFVLRAPLFPDVFFSGGALCLLCVRKRRPRAPTHAHTTHTTHAHTHTRTHHTRTHHTDTCTHAVLQAEKLLAESDELLVALDAGVKDLNGEQDTGTSPGGAQPVSFGKQDASAPSARCQRACAA